MPGFCFLYTLPYTTLPQHFVTLAHPTSQLYHPIPYNLSPIPSSKNGTINAISPSAIAYQYEDTLTHTHAFYNPWPSSPNG